MNEGKQEGWKSSRNTRKAVWWRRVLGADSTGGGEPEEGAGRLDAGEPGQQPDQQPSLRQVQDDARTTRLDARGSSQKRAPVHRINLITFMFAERTGLLLAPRRQLKQVQVQLGENYIFSVKWTLFSQFINVNSKKLSICSLAYDKIRQRFSSLTFNKTPEEW